jgi:hypothetical protein
LSFACDDGFRSDLGQVRKERIVDSKSACWLSQSYPLQTSHTNNDYLPKDKMFGIIPALIILILKTLLVGFVALVLLPILVEALVDGWPNLEQFRNMVLFVLVFFEVDENIYVPVMDRLSRALG